MYIFRRGNGDIAYVRRIDDIRSPNFGKYYVALTTVSGSHNDVSVPYAVSLNECLEYLTSLNFANCTHDM